ncbi:hypothetical protein [Flavihumibacter petaseus]|uniref:hypothetical protein n=1 Tax=Flavihumibacter petaseus TaxID=549295 RepID=UPI00061CEABB|nr:hypothetical protein [Flavihumibacter petaseus]
MIRQYPHTAFFTIPATVVQDANGNWTEISGTSSTIEQICRLETRTGRNDAYITGEDGVKVEMTAVIYMPVNAPKIAVGTWVVVKDKYGAILRSTVKQYSKGQLNTRIWV